MTTFSFGQFSPFFFSLYERPVPLPRDSPPSDATDMKGKKNENGVGFWRLDSDRTICRRLSYFGTDDCLEAYVFWSGRSHDPLSPVRIQSKVGTDSDDWILTGLFAGDSLDNDMICPHDRSHDRANFSLPSRFDPDGCTTLFTT